MSNEKHPPLPMCACLHVEYDPMRLPNGTSRDRWRCKNCGVEFVRDLKPNWLDMYDMVQEMHRSFFPWKHMALDKTE